MSGKKIDVAKKLMATGAIVAGRPVKKAVIREVMQVISVVQ